MSKDVALLITRILLVAIFPISAYFKIKGWPGIVGPLTGAGLPFPYALGMLGVAMEIVLPALVIAGIATRPAALGLILYTAMATYIGHPVWNVPEAAFFSQLMSFMKNVGMIGALLLLAVFGPGRLAVQPSDDAGARA